jgi:hypothetical protein
MLDRIIGAFTFRKGVYAEVERDQGFTTTAWLLVVVVAFLQQFGGLTSQLGDISFVKWVFGIAAGTVFTVLGFAVAALVISWVGKTVFNAEVDFGEMVRTLGLANVWNALGIFKIVNAFGFLACLLSPLSLAIAILTFAAWLVAAREALDLEWLQTIVTIVIGWLVIGLFTIITGLVLTAIGLAAGVFGVLN